MPRAHAKRIPRILILSFMMVWKTWRLRAKVTPVNISRRTLDAFETENVKNLTNMISQVPVPEPY